MQCGGEKRLNWAYVTQRISLVEPPHHIHRESKQSSAEVERSSLTLTLTLVVLVNNEW